MSNEIVRDVKFFVEAPPSGFLDPKIKEAYDGAKSRPDVLRAILNLPRQEKQDSPVCSFLAERRWGISLATVDLDKLTAEVVRDLNHRYPEIPVVMWIILKEKDGYWVNAENIPQAKQRVKDLEDWIDFNDLSVVGYGFDIEPPKSWFDEDLKGSTLEKAKAVFLRQKHLRDLGKRQLESIQELKQLIDDLKKRNISTESYEMPRIIEKVVGSFPLNTVDARFSMLYSSTARDLLSAVPFGDRLEESAMRIASHFSLSLNPDNTPSIFPAFGIVSSIGTDPGTRFEGKPPLPHIKEQELTRDMTIVANQNSHYLDKIRIFALTGIEVAEWTENALKTATHLTTVCQE